MFQTFGNLVIWLLFGHWCLVLGISVRSTVWAPPFSLAATKGMQFVFFPPGTEMFHFPGYANSDKVGELLRFTQ